MRTITLWSYLIMWAILAWTLGSSIWNYFKAWKFDFDEGNARQHNRRINVRAARSAAIVLPQLAIPLGLVVIALMIYNLIHYESLEVYIITGIFWFVSAPLRRFWVIYTAIRVDQRLREFGLHISSRQMPSPWEATKSYYLKGIRSWRTRPNCPECGLFNGRFKLSSKMSWLWRQAGYLRVGIPVLIEVLTSSMWSTTATYMTLLHSYDAQLHVQERPWWARTPSN